MTDSDSGTRILKLTASNVKRLAAVEIQPSGNVVVVGGKNGAGKSSVLDAIQYALGGAKAIPSEPLRRGEKSGEVVVELDNGLIVERRFSPGGRSTLAIRDGGGRMCRSPQAILDSLYNQLCFDPLEFSRLAPSKQKDVLQRLVGLDFEELDQSRKDLYDERTATNKEVQKARLRLSEMPHHDRDVPGELVRVSDIVERIMEANKSNHALQQKQNAAARLEMGLDECEQHILDLEQQIQAAKELRGDLKSRVEQAREEAHGDPIDVSEMEKQVDEAETINAKVRENQAREQAKQEMLDIEKASRDLTARIKEIDSQKEQMLASTEMPVDGLAFDSDGVTYNGIPYEQCSSAEQLRISAAMGMAMSPKLRVMLIRDGSLMDSDSMSLLQSLASKQDYQVWIECVGDHGQVVLEDGRLSSVPESGCDDQDESSEQSA